MDGNHLIAVKIMEQILDYVSQLENRVETMEKILSEISIDFKEVKKEKFKTKKQSVALNGLQRALCVDTMDFRKENKVRFYHPLIHNPNTPIKHLPWAKPVSSMGGIDDSGLCWVPPAGSTLALIFENGNRGLPYYLGTIWHRDRGPNGRDFPIPVPEYNAVYSGHRGGYLLGPNDESQVQPPWNTENYNGNDYNSFEEFSSDPEEQQRLTYSNIYGFKTPEKHMVKLVDGDAKCNRRFKRIEIQSSCGNWFIMKDDHLHYGGQWSNPACQPNGAHTQDISHCSTSEGDLPYFTDPHGKPIEGDERYGWPGCDPGCNSKTGTKSCSNILGGHPSTPGNPPDNKTIYHNSQGGSNKFFKHQNECRPYQGPRTPQNNRCSLPQTGIQLLSIGGHTLVMDDSVEEPSGAPIWERSTEPFDFGCSNKCLGVMYMKSMTGHSFTMSDIESEEGLRSEDNYIELKSASGNKIQLNDHTVGSGGCTPCPPNYAGEQSGVLIQSRSNHTIRMSDHMNEQCSPCRSEGGVPEARASQAFMQLRSGYGSEIMMSDDNSQQETQNQWIQITNPQCAGDGDVTCNRERGPHLMRFQARPAGQPGVIFLRAGGHSIRSTYDMDIVMVGDKDKNPSDKFTYVSRNNLSSTEKTDFRYAGELHVMMAEKKILLLAGRECPPRPEKKCKGPCVYPVVVGRCPTICPLTGILHWTQKSLSERVFASANHECSVCPSRNMECPPRGQNQPCVEDEENINIDTGNENIQISVNNPNQFG